MRSLMLYTLLAGFILFGAVIPLNAAGNDTGYWGVYGVKGKLNEMLGLSSDIQFRVRDDFGDFHFFRWESGATAKPLSWLDLSFFYRLNPRKQSGEWSNQHYLLLDQTLKGRLSPNWGVDWRNRFYIKLGELGRSFVRERVQVTRKINRASSWFVYNEFWIQTSELDGRDRYNVNWFSTGIKFKLPGGFDFSPHYLLRTDKGKTTGEWSTLHVLGTSLYYSF